MVIIKFKTAYKIVPSMHVFPHSLPTHGNIPKVKKRGGKKYIKFRYKNE